MRRAIMALAVCAACLTAAGPARFRPHTLAADLKGGYQVYLADVNRDGTADLVALASGMNELFWFEGPDWKRHVLAAGMSGMINLAACSEDAAGYPVFVIAHGFSSRAEKSIGAVSVLRRDGAVDQPWRREDIDRLPTSHRIRCADIDGDGRRVFVNAPLTAADARPPDYRRPVPLVCYAPGEWKRTLIGDGDEGVMHGIHVVDWDGDGKEEILTASFSGIHRYGRVPDGSWKRTAITAGDPAPWPNCGASDVTVGQLAGERFLASIEPWHGNQVVVYRRDGSRWVRRVIDDTYADGHTVVTADLNGDGRDEIIGGCRQGPRSVYIYHAGESALEWRRTTLDDGGIAAASCAVADLNADGRPDIACIGSATANLKWYENLGPEE